MAEDERRDTGIAWPTRPRRRSHAPHQLRTARQGRWRVVSGALTPRSYSYSLVFDEPWSFVRNYLAAGKSSTH